MIKIRRLLAHVQAQLMPNSYQRAYVDFFEDQLVLHGYNWRQVLDEFMFNGKEPLINCLIAGCMPVSLTL